MGRKTPERNTLYRNRAELLNRRCFRGGGVVVNIFLPLMLLSVFQNDHLFYNLKKENLKRTEWIITSLKGER